MQCVLASGGYWRKIKRKGRAFVDAYVHSFCTVDYGAQQTIS